jgi:omega-6 fatty acid desaturase (delta-12 desaturase)
MVPLRGRKRMKRSHVYTNLALAALVGGVIWAIGWQAYLLVQLPTMLIAGSAGVWLFYVQHQFEDVYWTRNGEWSYLDAALRGSSHLKLPKVLQFFTGNIGLHHIHHLQPRIPNYNLQRAHDENEFLHAAPVLTLWCGLKTVRLKLYDEASGRLVTFRQANASPAAQLAGAG